MVECHTQGVLLREKEQETITEAGLYKKATSSPYKLF